MSCGDSDDTFSDDRGPPPTDAVDTEGGGASRSAVAAAEVAARAARRSAATGKRQSPVATDRAPRKKRRAHVASRSIESNAGASGGEIFAADKLKPLHGDWDTWLRYRADYEEKSNTRLVIKETESVAKRNKQLVASKKGKENRVRLLPEDLPVWRKLYICTHGWQLRRRGRGVRTRRQQRSTACPFRFLAEHAYRDGAWRVEIRCPVYEHNHSSSQTQHSHYAQKRSLPLCEPVVDDTRLMVKVGGKTLRIYEYICTHSDRQAAMRDAHDLLAKLRAVQRGGAADDVAVAEYLVEFGEKDPGNVSSVDETSTGETGAISLSTRHMRRMFQSFPELLLVDCTHKTNLYDYQPCSLMVLDSFGVGQVVQHSVVETTSDWHLQKMLDHFKTANANWADVRVIVVDKVTTEVAVLWQNFPDATVLLCHFHVLEYLRTVVRAARYGTHSEDEYESMGHLLHSLVYANSAEEFDLQLSLLRRLSCSNGNGSFWTYFHENWVDTQDMWTSHRRTRLPHFRNHTNTRLESNFGKMQLDLDSTATMKECLESLMRHQARSESEYTSSTPSEGAWLNAHYSHDLDLPLDSQINYSKTVRPPIDYDVAKATTSRDKYSAAHRLLNRVAQELADLPQLQFTREMLLIERYLKRLRQQGDRPTLQPGERATVLTGQPERPVQSADHPGRLGERPPPIN